MAKNRNTTSKAQFAPLHYSPKTNRFYCNECGGQMSLEKAGKPINVIVRCDDCGHAVDGRIVDFATARNNRIAYLSSKLAEAQARTMADDAARMARISKRVEQRIASFTVMSAGVFAVYAIFAAKVVNLF